VSHDRDFVNNCVNTCLYFDGTGHINQIVGGYDDVDDYLEQKKTQRQAMENIAQENVKEKEQKKVNFDNTSAVKAVIKKKLSFKETRELEALPLKIDELETEIDSLQEQVNAADFFSKKEEVTKKILNQLKETESNLEAVYARWQELDES